MTDEQKLEAWGDDVPLRGADAPKNDGRIEYLIQYLLTVRKRFGNTAVTADLQWGATALWKRDEQKERIAALEARIKVARPGPHDGEYCATDKSAAAVCDGTYAERTDEVLGLVEALQAISALAAGHDDQSKAITKLIEDAIEEHAAWTR